MQLFQGQCKRLPKSLRDWEAYLELKKTIDDFLELQPVLELLAVPAVKDRHWKEIMKISNHSWRLDSDLFKLQNILDAQLLRFKEDIEDIALSSVKEADIEGKKNNIAGVRRVPDDHGRHAGLNGDAARRQACAWRRRPPLPEVTARSVPTATNRFGPAGPPTTFQPLEAAFALLTPPPPSVPLFKRVPVTPTTKPTKRQTHALPASMGTPHALPVELRAWASH